QWLFRVKVIGSTLSVRSELLECSGQGAPNLTQVVSASIASAGSLPVGGIFTSPSWRTARIRALSDGLPGLTTGPVSLPLSRASRESSRRPAFCFFSPWQEKQFSASMGRTRFSKNSVAWGPAVDGGATSACTAVAATNRPAND